MQKILFFVIAGLAGFVLAEGIVTDVKSTQGNPVKQTISWTASTNGVVSETDLSNYSRGIIERVILDGSSTGTTYSLTLKDSSGVDVLAGLGAGVSTSVVYCVVPGISVTDGTTTNVVPFAVNDLLSLEVTVAGSNRTGSVVLYIR